jgi:uncharacterized protein (TIGR02246 family)
MNITRTILCGVAALAIAQVATAADEHALAQEMQDRAAIEALMWKYVRALDTLDADAYAAVYTPDGQFGTGERAEKGAAALKKMITDLKDGRAKREAGGAAASPAMYHVVMNHTIEFLDRDHARYDSYWTTMFGSSGQDQPPRVAAIGRSIDMLVRVNGKWLIQTRDVAPK